MIADVVKQTIGLVDILKVTGTAEETRIQGVDANKTLFIEAYLREPLSELSGEFGITNLNMLRGLLDFATYRTEKSTFSVKRMMIRDRDGELNRETVEQFEFRDGTTGAGADFRCMSPDRVPDQADIKNVPWDITIKPSKSKISEFQQLASLYSDVDKNFGAKTENGNLLFFFGDDNSSTHRASMVFESGVEGSLNAGLQWSAAQLIQVLKLANSEGRIRITSRGVLSVEVETTHGSYKYFLRAMR
ncbi:MAG: hypothetical protein EOP83_34315 [Verrucomicrobiaceae bacterium]|nr:MAG: hypothetical protein EOP83_34315 [Verrucomicrobiaceae bacterium]